MSVGISGGSGGPAQAIVTDELIIDYKSNEVVYLIDT